MVWFIGLVAILTTKGGSDMTLEELKFMQQYPRIPAERVPAVLAEVKRQRAIAEEAKRAAKQRVDLR
jgi:hypothetical protein